MPSRIDTWIAELLKRRLKATDACAVWEFAERKGYAAIKRDGAVVNAAIVIWELKHKKPWPLGKHVLHGENCTTTMCVHPLHVRPGTQAENMADKKRDGTNPEGESNPSAKLDNAAVADIRARAAKHEKKTSLAKEYGVSVSTIASIITGRTWGKPAMEAMQLPEDEPLDLTVYEKVSGESLKALRFAMSEETWGQGWELVPAIVFEYAEWVVSLPEYRELPTRKTFAEAYGLKMQDLRFMEEHEEFQRLILERNKANGVPRYIVNMAMERLIERATGKGATPQDTMLFLRQTKQLVAETQIIKTDDIASMTKEELMAEAAKLGILNERSLGVIETTGQRVESLDDSFDPRSLADPGDFDPLAEVKPELVDSTP